MNTTFWALFVTTVVVVACMNVLVRRVVLDLFESSPLDKEQTDEYGFRDKFIFVGGKLAAFREIRIRHPWLLGAFYLYCLTGAVFLYVSAT